MKARDFLQRLLPPEGGWYVGHAQHKTQGTRHQSFRTVERMVTWLEFWDHKGFDCYFAVASFQLEKTYDQDAAGAWKMHRRAKKNLPVLMNFHQDIDTKLTHATAHYNDAEEAAVAVLAFCRARGLPAPFWVMSGGGLHVYWHLARPLDMDSWLPLAQGFKKCLLEFPVHIGKERAADPTSILRVPGFHHWKTGNIVTAGGIVTDIDPALFEQFKQEIDHVHVHTGASRNELAPIANAVADSLWYGPSSVDLVRSRCLQLGECAARPGTFSEPFHRGVAGLARQCGPDEFERYIAGVPVEWRAMARDKGLSWTASAPTCAYFRDNSPRPEICEACPVKDAIGSPIRLGRTDFDWPGDRHVAPPRPRTPAQDGGSLPATTPREAAQERAAASEWIPVDPDGLNGFPLLNAPWGVVGDRIVWTTESTKGKPVHAPVSGHLIYVDGVHKNESTGLASYTLKHKLPHEGWTTINIGSEFFSDSRFHGELLRQHVVVHDAKLLRQYVIEQVEQYNRDHKMRDTRYEQCGWKDIALPGPAFLHGLILHAPWQPQPAPAVVSDDLGQRIRRGLCCMPGGSARELVTIQRELFKPDNFPAWHAILASYASICHAFFDRASGGILNNYVGPSGGGKTVAVAAAIAVWGHWDAHAIKPFDTSPSIGLALASLGNLPAVIDEIHHFATDPQFGAAKLRAFLDMFSAGTDKHRALQYGVGVRSQQARFCMNAFSTSNQSIVDMSEVSAQAMDGVAVTMRIFEQYVPPGDFDDFRGNQLKEQLNLHAGWCGDAFLRALMQSGVLPEFRAALERNKAAIWKASELRSEQRYRIYMIAGCATVAPILRDMGLLPSDLDISALIEYLIEQVRMRSPAPETYQPSPALALEILAKFLVEHTTNTLRVQHPYKSGLTQVPLGQKPHRLVVRYEFSTGRAYTPTREFKKFVVDEGYPYTETIGFLKQARIVINDKRWITLGAGTEYATAQAPCLELDVTHPAVCGVIRPITDSSSDQPIYG